MKTILILASNPRKDLQLGYEIHALQNIIKNSENLQKFSVVIDDAIAPQNIQRLFLEHKPRIVHFCGHGSGANGLLFVNSSGEEQPVRTQALSNLFKEFKDIIECVLLNACYSQVQANAIAQHIDYAIGMNQAITDDAAIFFAKGFYQALGQGKQIPQCFRLGKNAIELELSKLSGQTRKFEVLDEECKLIPEHLKPAIKIKSQLTHSPKDEDVARQKYTQDNREYFGLGKREQQIQNRREHNFRKILLNKVKDFWIEGFFKNSLHTKELLRLEIKGRADLVHNPFSQYQELPVDPNSSYEWLQATDVFEQMGDGRTLLILGEPGSGKTIALLKLAKKFIENAEKNLSLPIPVVFNLSSWTKRKSIAEWLAIELKEKYQVSKSFAKNWIQQEQLLLLLDGLDEVEKEQRNDCIVAINEFLNSHKTTEIVICSRFQEYESLSEKLRLRNAIYIQSLTSEHIDWYLKDTGDRLLGLKTLLKNDPEIEEFAKTPLILSIMSVTYQNYSSEAVLEQLRSPNNRYKNLFDSYIQRMLGRRDSRISEQNKNLTSYPQDKVLHWLSLLAKTMVDESQSIFLIEKMQPTLLQNRDERTRYKNSSFLTIVLILGSIGLMVGLTIGLIEGLLIVGLIVGLIYGLIVGLLNGGDTCIQHFNLRRILYRKGRIPWNYADFLDYASERLLMKKVGGGYIFYHRMLMEHFAQRHRVFREPVTATPSQTPQPVALANTRTKIRSSNINHPVPQSNNLVRDRVVCSSCGHRNPTTGKFCTQCGNELIESK